LGFYGNARSSTVPFQVSNLSGIVAIASGGWHSLALTSDGNVWGWGDNYDGQLGVSGIPTTYLPVQVRELSGVAAIACGDRPLLSERATVWP
jgi:alpha-tubulin suppressor-like RCC1 family protein